MSFYSDMAATAAGMLAEFGQAVTISRAGPGAYDTATGTTTTVSPTSWTVSAVQEAYAGRQIDGTLVKAGDVRLLVSAEAAPALEDAVMLADGTVGTVKAVEPFSPGGTVLYYTLRVRR